MIALLNKLLDLIFSKTTVISFVLGSLIAVLSAVIAGAAFGEIDIQQRNFTEIRPAYATLMSFGVVLCIATLMSFILLGKENEDLYTPLRKLLKGTWSVHYADHHPNPEGKVEPETANDIAEIGINVSTKKLYIKINLANHPVYSDDNFLVSDISINPTHNPAYLTYSHRVSTTNRLGQKIEGEIFVRMQIQFDQTKQRPIKMVGTWYDLDNVFSESKRQFYEAKYGKSFSGEYDSKGFIEYVRV